MHPSFQGSTYSHAFQANIHGPSNLKIFDGEDLSTNNDMQQAETASDSNRFNQTFGGVSSKTKRKEENKCSRQRGRVLTLKLFKLTSIEDSFNSRNRSD